MVRILGRCSLRGAGLKAKYRPYRRCEGLKARQGPFLARDSRPYFALQDTLIVLPSDHGFDVLRQSGRKAEDVRLELTREILVFCQALSKRSKI
jgi:hypothetical protein